MMVFAIMKFANCIDSILNFHVDDATYILGFLVANTQPIAHSLSDTNIWDPYSDQEVRELRFIRW